MSIKILGAEISDYDMLETLCQVHLFIKENRFHQIITLNAEMLYQAQENEKLMSIIKAADLVTPDGSGIVWASCYLGQGDIERVSGIDLMQEICSQAKGHKWSIYLLGGAPDIAYEAAAKLKEKYEGINITGIQHGYYKPEEEESVVKAINQVTPDVLFVAMGSPRQEYFINKYKDQLQVRVAIGVGGSLDVISGKTKRAPKWVQKLGLEWLWRVLKEPKRIKRTFALPCFVLAVKKAKKTKRSC